MNSRLRFGVATSLTIVLIASACAEPDPVLLEETTTAVDDTMDTDETMAMGEEATHEAYAFGEPSDEEPDRVIEVTAVDAFAFEPSELTVEVGETVTFRVTNEGKIPHDFTLGDAHMQDEHEAEMAEMGGEMQMHDEPNVFSLAPGETKEMTWTFTEAGGILMGCHQTGHYAAGMVGTITITS